MCKNKALQHTKRVIYLAQNLKKGDDLYGNTKKVPRKFKFNSK